MAVVRDPISGRFYSDGRPLTEEERAQRRADKQSFRKGFTYNSVGRRGGGTEVKALLKEASPAAARRLIELVGSDNERIALQAASAILDRVFGKPAVAVQVETNSDVSLETRALIRELILERKAEEHAELPAPNPQKTSKTISTPAQQQSSVPLTRNGTPKMIKVGARDAAKEFYDVEDIATGGRKRIPIAMSKAAKKFEKPKELADVDGVLNIVE